MVSDKNQVAVSSLFIMAASAMFSSVTAYYARNLILNFLCSPTDPAAYVTHIPWDCSSYVICMNGQAIPTPCPTGKLYASATRNSKCEPAAQVDGTRCHRHIWSYIRTICMHNPQGVVHDPERCGQYFDCTLTNDNIALTSGVEKSAPNTLAESLPFLSSARSGDAGSVTSGVVTRAPSVTTGQEWIEYLVECPYPDLFSTQAGSCQDHRMVSCGEREEPKAPCDYLQYLQLYDCNGIDCLTCTKSHPSCVGLSDGKQPVPRRSDVIMECQGERTINIFSAAKPNTDVLGETSTV
ncbi:hypothetical protein RRG08_019182 [Elysia crispata]|uniref:Chitin-binding type-2 domain-containing protein n=1 Tax=Elysia crispata TaxID=231223 RepID=A0AAE0ZY24_9GAST|nr:hypothetical protein RRG08_019182 [Elysia crispata]